MEGNFILLFLVLFPMAGAFVSYLIGRKIKKQEIILQLQLQSLNSL